MYVLTDEQIAFILEEIRRNGIESEELQIDLLDHICCVIETEMLPDTNFDEFYRSIIPRFYKRELKEIQEETQLLLTFKNYYAMKKVMIISGAFSAFTFTAGSLFKIMHWPGASLLFQAGIVFFCLLFLPILSILKVKEQKQRKDKLLIGIATLFAIVVCLATLFRVMHWPFANILWSSSLGMLFFLFLPIYFFGGIRNPETKTNTIISSILILTAGVLLFILTNLRSSHSSEEAVFNSDDQLLASYTYLSEQRSSDSLSENQQLLIKKADTLCLKIEKLKVGLIKSITPDGKEMLENEAIRLFGNKFDPVQSHLFAENGKESKELAAIKKDLTALQKLVQENTSDKECALISTENIHRSDYTNQELSWEEFYFKNLPLENVIRNFNQLLVNIRIVVISNN
jgi:hypothetical protein